MKRLVLFMIFMGICFNGYAYQNAIPVDGGGNQLGTSSNPISATIAAGSNLNANIGIGSTNPRQALDVNGTVKATAFSGSGSYTVDSNGNVGIGTNSPRANLEVNGSIAVPYTANLTVYDSGQNPSTSLSFSGTGAMTLGNVARITFGNNNSIQQNTPVNYSEQIVTGPSSNINTMTWRETGNVGVGSITPGQLLDVAGTARVTSFIDKNAAAQAGQAACWTTNGQAGYCTGVVGAGGACSCTGL